MAAEKSSENKNVKEEELKKVSGGDNELPTANCPECGTLTVGHYVTCFARFICPKCGNMWDL